MLINTEGFILKNQKYGEQDSLLIIFTRKLGKINAIAKGARRPKSSLLAGIQPFSYSDFILYRGKSLYTVNQCETKEIFYPLREDLKKLSYGAYLIELVEAVITEGQTNNRLFNLFGKTLYLLKKEDIELNTIIRAFELKLMNYVGYKPQLKICVSCGSANAELWKFSPEEGGILCNKCQSIDPFALKINAVTIKLANYLLVKDISEIQRLKISTYLNEELKKILRAYFVTHINKYDFKSLEVAEKL